MIGALFVNLSPEFGGKLTDELKKVYSKSSLWDGEKFVNQTETTMDMPASELPGMMYKFIFPEKNRRPSQDLIPIKPQISYNGKAPRLIWFGHSSFLLQINGKNILIDPMFGSVPAPHPLLGNKRFNSELPIEIDHLPKIDALILSHDHYDHLDYGSIMKLKDKVDQYYLPLGVGRHFESWGISGENVHEMDWWDEAKVDDILLAFTPSRHFSGRGPADRATTLWGSWVIKSDSSSIYFSGDGGYANHFKTIGEKYGPFDFAMLECGQYNDLWSQIHMMPEETAQAAVDLRAKVSMPIHWGGFTLAMHKWRDPIERFQKKANALNVVTCTPRIGEPILVGEKYPRSDWWEGIE